MAKSNKGDKKQAKSKGTSEGGRKRRRERANKRTGYQKPEGGFCFTQDRGAKQTRRYDGPTAEMVTRHRANGASLNNRLESKLVEINGTSKRFAKVVAPLMEAVNTSDPTPKELFWGAVHTICKNALERHMLLQYRSKLNLPIPTS